MYQSHLDDDLRDFVTKHGWESIALRRGWFPTWEPHGPDDDFRFTFWPQPAEDEEFRFQEGLDIFFDGSAYDVGDPFAAAAGTGLVQHVAGKVVCSLKATVPHLFPKNAAFAEHLGALLAERFSRGSSQRCAVADCASVVTSYTRGWDFATGHKRPAAGLWADVDFSGFRVRKTKAHRSRAEAESQGDVDDYLGNGLADKLAKEAATLGRPPPAALRRWDLSISARRKFLRFVAAVLDLWKGTSPAGSSRAAGRTLGPSVVRVRTPHLPVFHEGFRLYRCALCLSAARTKHRLQTSSCSRVPKRLLALIDRSRAQGHRLMFAAYAHGPGSLVYCSRCGYYAEARVDNLVKPCDGREGICSARYLESWRHGMHPISKREMGKPTRLPPSASLPDARFGGAVTPKALSQGRAARAGSQASSGPTPPHRAVHGPLGACALALLRSAFDDPDGGQEICSEDDVG